MIASFRLAVGCGGPCFHAFAGEGDILRITGPHFKMMRNTSTAESSQTIASNVRMFDAGPCDDFTTVAICIMEPPVLIWGLKGNNYMSHYSVRTHYKYSIAGAHFREIVQLAAWIGSVTKNKGADHGGVATAPVILTDTVDVHDPVGCSAGDLVFVGPRPSHGANPV